MKDDNFYCKTLEYVPDYLFRSLEIEGVKVSKFTSSKLKQVPLSLFKSFKINDEIASLDR